MHFRRSDAADPLGGVIDVLAIHGGQVQVVNFDNSPAGGFPKLVHLALEEAIPIPGTALQVTPLDVLIAFKLYAGGLKSSSDIAELLARHPELDRQRLIERMKELGLQRQLRRVLAAMADDDD